MTDRPLRPRTRHPRPFDFDDWTALVLILPLAGFAWVLGHQHLIADGECGAAGRYVRTFGSRLPGLLAIATPVLAVVAASQLHNRALQRGVFFLAALAELTLIAIPLFGGYESCV